MPTFPSHPGNRRVPVVAALTVLSAMAVMAASCSSSSGNAGSAQSSTTKNSSETTTTRASAINHPTGPAAVISAPLAGGNGVFLAASNPDLGLDKVGYEQTEYAAAGTATSYTAATLPTDGSYDLQPGPTASYNTRLVVRRPKDPKKFNGTVIVEWLNVSGGVDADPDYTYMADEITRGGYAWVGVSAQRIGIEGGPVAVVAPGADKAGAGKGLRAIDPARYGQLHHPGDAYSYDIYTQVAQALRVPGQVNPLAGMKPKQFLAVGESQSAFTLTTYYDGVQPLTHEFDGFIIHSRGGAPAPLGTADSGIDIQGSLSGKPTTLRTDVAAPVIMVETESDVLGLLGYYPATQPDNDHLRLWEVAGTAHADLIQIGADREPSLGCSVPINRGQQVFVLRAALRHLSTWVAGGAPPPHAARFGIDTSGAKPAYVEDANGNVTGGVRTPSVDAPVSRLSGIAPAGSSVLCLLLGSTTPLSSAQLTALYPTRANYLKKYTEATDAAIKAGFVLPQDRAAVLADAQPDAVANS